MNKPYIEIRHEEFSRSLSYRSYKPEKGFNAVITDAPYDLTKSEILAYHNVFLDICIGVIIVFMPPKNPWVDGADQLLFWAKPISTKNTCKNYSNFMEQIFVYGRNAWNTDRHWSNYVNIFVDRVDTVKNHSFRKPPSLIERLILNHTNEGDWVLDPFAGSGVVPELCKKLGRNCVAFERDEEYYNHILSILED